MRRQSKRNRPRRIRVRVSVNPERPLRLRVPALHARKPSGFPAHAEVPFDFSYKNALSMHLKVVRNFEILGDESVE